MRGTPWVLEPQSNTCIRKTVKTKSNNQTTIAEDQRSSLVFNGHVGNKIS